MGSVSIADMERVALGGDDGLRMDADIGNVIELGDLNDDLGLSLLSNPSKISVSRAPDTGRSVSISSFAPPEPAAPPASISFSTGGGGGGGSNSLGIDITPLEPLEPISVDENFGLSEPEISISRPAPASSAAPATPSAGGGNSSGGGFMSSLFGNNQTATGPGITLASGAPLDPAAEKKEKSEYLNKLQRLEQKGFPVSRKFTMDNSLDEIKTEFFRLVDARQLETSLKFQRQMLMGAITGLEWLNGRFDPFDLKLDGWSESVHENIEDFDEIFEELYDKYKDRGKMSPEMRLVMAIGGSGFMCHVSNSFFRSKMPSMDDVLRSNPQLARQMAAAAAQQAGPGFGNFMGMAMGMPPAGQAGFPGNGGPSGPIPQGPAPSMAMPTPDVGAFYAASANSPGPVMPGTPAPPPVVPQTARREMSGPTGVDDILRTFEEVRRAEAATMGGQPATGFMTQPAVAAVRSGAGSVISADEMLSQADTARTGATSGRRRRKAQPPVGNTVSLNV